MWLSLVERCVRDAETARSNRAIPTIQSLRVCFTANPFFMPNARRKKKGILPYEEFPLRHRNPPQADASDRVGNDRLRGQQIRVDSQPDARGAGVNHPMFPALRQKQRIPLFQPHFLAIHVVQAGFALKHHDPFIQILIIPFAFGSDLPVGDDAFHADAARTRRKGLEKFRLFKRGIRVLIYKKGCYVFRP